MSPYSRTLLTNKKKKMHIMRTKICGYILGALLLGMGLQSCKNGDVLPNEGRYPILFGSYDTRAVADLDDIKEEGFKVYAYFVGNVGSSTFEKAVTYKSEQNIWAYEPLEYWIPNTEYWFKAFYPSSFTAGTLTVDNTSQAQNFTIANFDVVNHQEDIMVASAQCSVPDGAFTPADGSVVKLNFSHLLANIEIKIKSAVSGITINSIVIEKAENYGRYDGGVWSSTETGHIEYSSGVLLNVGDDFKSVTGDGILVIPASATGKTLVVKASNKEYRADFPEGTEWQKGNKYAYTLEIKQSNIIFNEPEVEKWDSENATGSVIIK